MGVVKKIDHDTNLESNPNTSDLPATNETTSSVVSQVSSDAAQDKQSEAYQTARKRIKTLIVAGLIGVVVIVVALAISCGSRGTRSVPTTTTATDTSQSTESSSSRKEKNAFNSSRKSTVEIAGVEFQVPSYFSESSSSTENNRVFSAESGSAVASLAFRMGTNATLTTQQLQNIDEDEISEYLGDNATLKSVTKSENGKVAGLPARQFVLETTIQGAESQMCLVFFLNEQAGTVGQCLLVQTNNTKYDYKSDFEKIIQSATLVQNESEQKTSEEQTTEQQEQAAPAEQPSSAVSADLKEALDSYEAFIDEYIAFMQRYSESDNALSMMTDYLSYLERYSDLSQKMEALDDNGDMSETDLAYYSEVMLRCSQKLLSASL